MKSGNGVEHHFPHLYSQVGAGGLTVYVAVHKDADVVDGFGVVVGGLVVGVVYGVETDEVFLRGNY